MTESIQQNEINRFQDIIFDEAKEILDECFHTPDDMNEFLGFEEIGDKIGKHFKCRCGKEVIEMYNFQEMREL